LHPTGAGARATHLQYVEMRILISAGEASGEMYGAQLMEALRRCLRNTTSPLGTGSVPADSTARLEFFGVGGERMRDTGCEIIVDAKDLSVVGITEIVSHLSKIWGLFHTLTAAAEKREPDLAIVIDSPAFNWRVARAMRKRGIPVVYYVAPQFWAWRQGRVRLLRKYVDKALVIFPFEEKFYRDRGVDATFVGHPLAHLPRPSISRSQYAAQNLLNPEKMWIALMPGSRLKEVRMNLPTILQSAARLGTDYEFLLPLAPTLDGSVLRSFVGPGPPPIRFVAEAFPALAHARAGIIASGTATIEAAMMGTPFVMVYRVSALTYALGRPRVKVPHFAMVNLVAEKNVVPELVQQDFTAARVVACLEKIIQDGPARDQMVQAFEEVKIRLQGPGHDSVTPPELASRAILEMMENLSRVSPPP
jgi:lipid-A-disaccharide synthase